MKSWLLKHPHFTQNPHAGVLNNPGSVAVLLGQIWQKLKSVDTSPSKVI